MSFLGLMRGEGHIVYAAFDLLWINGRDLRQRPLTQRKKRLEPLSKELEYGAAYIGGSGDGLFKAACRLDLEGIVAKRKADTYRPATLWYKIKNPTYSQAEGRGELV